jgi:hypothetical protein
MDLGKRLKKADAGICQAALGERSSGVAGVQELQNLRESQLEELRNRSLSFRELFAPSPKQRGSIGFRWRFLLEMGGYKSKMMVWRTPRYSAGADKIL